MYHTEKTRTLLFIDNGQTYEELCQILDDEYSINVVTDITAAKDILRDNNTDIQQKAYLNTNSYLY